MVTGTGTKVLTLFVILSNQKQLYYPKKTVKSENGILELRFQFYSNHIRTTNAKKIHFINKLYQFSIRK